MESSIIHQKWALVNNNIDEKCAEYLYETQNVGEVCQTSQMQVIDHQKYLLNEGNLNAISTHQEKIMNHLDEVRRITDAADVVTKNKSEKMDKIQEIVEGTLSDRSKQQVLRLLDQISLLSGPERLLLYLRLPSGSSSSCGNVDPLRQPPNPLGTRSEISSTAAWVRTHLEHDPRVSVPKQDVYEEYTSYCATAGFKPLSTADFGKVMKQVFPNLRPRRLGTRGHSRYCYAAMRKTRGLETPSLPDLDVETSLDTPPASVMEAWTVIKPWAEKILMQPVPSIEALSQCVQMIEDSPGGISEGTHEPVSYNKRNTFFKSRDVKKRVLQTTNRQRGKKQRVNHSMNRESDHSLNSNSSDLTAASIQNPNIMDTSQYIKAEPLHPNDYSDSSNYSNQLIQLQDQILIPPSNIKSNLNTVSHNLAHDQLVVNLKCTNNTEEILPMNLSTDNLAGTNAICDTDEMLDTSVLNKRKIIKNKPVERKYIKKSRTFSRRFSDELSQHDAENVMNKGGAATNSLSVIAPPLSNEKPMKLPLPRLPNKRFNQSPNIVMLQQFQKNKNIQPKPNNETQSIVVQSEEISVNTFNSNSPSDVSSPVVKDFAAFPVESLKYLNTKRKNRRPRKKSMNVIEGGVNSSLPSYNSNGSREIDSKSNTNTDSLGILPVSELLPRERVISICNLDKDALDGYLHGGDNSQEQEEELLQYFQQDNGSQEEGSSTSSKDVPQIAGQHNKPDRVTNDLVNSTSIKIKDEILSSHQDFQDEISQGKCDKLSQLRMLLEQNLCNTNIKTEDLSIQNSHTEPRSTYIRKYSQAVQDNMNSRQMSASASLTQLSQRQNISKQPPIPNTKAAGAMPIRRRVSFEPSQQDGLHVTDVIPQSPNSRRRNFSFMPISPGPLSPIATKVIPRSVSPKSCSTTASPFVSPRNTPVPRGRPNLHIKPIPKERKTEPAVHGEDFIALDNQNSTYSASVGGKFTAFSKPNCPNIGQVCQDSLGSEVSRFFPDGNIGQSNINFRSQSVPLHVKSLVSPAQSPLFFNQHQKMDYNRQFISYNNSASSSVAPTPIPAEFADFDNSNYLDILTDQNNLIPTSSDIIPELNNFNDNIALPILDSENTSNIYSTVQMNEILPQSKEYQQFDFDNSNLKRSLSIDNNFQNLPLDVGRSIISRSVPTTPVPYKRAEFPFPSNFNTDFEIASKSVPSTPIRDRNFRYSPTYNNRDFLINGNSVDAFKTNFLPENPVDNMCELEQRESSLGISNISDNLTDFSEGGIIAEDIIMSDLTANLLRIFLD